MANKIHQNIQVHGTEDYSMFKFLPGNRQVHDHHLKRLMESFHNRYLLSPIIVNEDFYIIDGQHRFLAAKELEIPVYYIVVPGFGKEEMRIYNINSRNWSKKDYLNMYCDEGEENYLIFRQFMEDYPDFTFSSCEALLVNRSGQGDKEVVRGSHGPQKAFEEGRFMVPDLEYSRKIADDILLVKPHYNGYKRSVFVRAMIAIFKKEEFKHSYFLKKLETNPGRLVHRGSVIEYKILIEDIYNYNLTDKNKINLRF